MKAHLFQIGEPSVSDRGMHEKSYGHKSECPHNAMGVSTEYLCYAVADHEANSGGAAFGQQGVADETIQVKDPQTHKHDAPCSLSGF